MDYYCRNNICKEFATYGYDQGENIFCKTHMLNDMILTFEQEQILELGEYEAKKKRKCYYISCNVEATYNFPEIKKPICCKSHILSGMIDIKHRKCLVDDCTTRPTFNFDGLKKADFCAIHKKYDMIEVISKKCLFEECKKQPTYNFEGKKAILCANHRENGMVDVKHFRCLFNGCDKLPSYNFALNTRPPK
jgi:hypothetical protein